MVGSGAKGEVMNRTASRIVGVIAIILAAGSAVLTVFYWVGIVVATEPRTKHGLLFAAIFVLLLLFGLIMLRSRDKVPGTPAK